MMYKRIVSYLLSAVVCVTSVQLPSLVEASKVNVLSTAAQGTALSYNSAIYPVPQKTTGSGTTFTVTSSINLVFEAEVDEATKNLARNILKEAGLTVTEGSAASETSTNVFVGIKGSNGVVNQFFNGVTYDQSIFTNEKYYDTYVLAVDGTKSAKGSIAVLGEDSDAAFYGLQSLRQLLVAMKNKTLATRTYEDYGDTEFRGFIEGSYGDPWSNDNRKTLMEFSGEHKMNTYIYAPKFEPYHNSQWRDLYPAAELDELKGLVQKGKDTKCEFVWAIHPGFSMIKWNDYDNEFGKLKAKFEQLYGIGVRQFAIMFDDGSNPGTANVVKLLTDVVAWSKTKEGVKDIIFCPTAYTIAQANGDRDQIQKAAAIDGVQVMSTGEKIIGSVNDANIKAMKDMMGNGNTPYFWLNWPTNDYADKRLLIGKAEILNRGTERLSGLVSNPMLLYPESNKVGLFQVADYAWNVEDFNVDDSWKASFHAIAPEVEAAYYKLAQHNSDPNSTYHGVKFAESEHIKGELERFLAGAENGTATTADGQALIKEFKDIVAAVEEFNTNCKNKALVTESAPWFTNLKNLSLAGEKAIEAVLEMCKETPNSGSIIENALQASSYYEESKKEKVWDDKKANGKTMLAESGGRRLMPFVESVVGIINKKANQLLGFDSGEKKVIFNFKNFAKPDFTNMIDGNDSTFVSLQSGIQAAGDFYGMDLGKTKKVTSVRILQGENDSDHNIFHNGKLQYSNDMETWTDIDATVEKDMRLITANNLNIKARYIRYYLENPSYNNKPDYWLRIREFTVTDEEMPLPVITNGTIEGVSSTKVDAVTSIKNANNITLKPGEYLGVQLDDNKLIQSISYEGSNKELTIESSQDGVVYTKGTEVKAARYVRLKNNTTSSITFNITSFTVTEKPDVNPIVTSNYTGVDAAEWNNILDGDWSTFAWTNSIQKVGSHVTYDMGSLQDVKDITLVVDDGTMAEGKNDYFRKGKLQVSENGEDWQDVHTFNGPGRTDNFPIHKVPNYYVTVDGINKKARYVRLYSTEEASAWLKLFEFSVNKDSGIVTKVNPSISSDDLAKDLDQVYKVADKNLDTGFTPRRDSGEIVIKNTTRNFVKEILTTQNGVAISNAKVSVRYQGSEEFVEVGTMNKMVTSFAIPVDKAVLETKISWTGGKIPTIYEVKMVTNPEKIIKEETNTTPTPPPVEVNKDELDKEITRAEAVDKTKFTETSLKVLEEKLTAAQLIKDKALATQAEINQAAKELKEAIDQLVPVEKPEEKPEILDGWVQQDNGSYRYYKNNVVVKNQWVQEGINWKYADEEGYLKTGWLQTGARWYYMDAEGIMKTDWIEVSGSWYFMNPDGAMHTGWLQQGDTWYYLAESGSMVTGWQAIAGTWYSFNGSGVMHTGWYHDGVDWYYLGTSGAMTTGWTVVSGAWYYMNGSGRMVTGWECIGGFWYYMNGSGAMHTGWLQSGNNWYYLANNGAMATGTMNIGGRLNQFASSGVWLGYAS